MTVHRMQPWHDHTMAGPFERLLERRILFLRGLMDEDAVGEVIGLLLALDGDSDDEIQLYIDSPGGVGAPGSAAAARTSSAPGSFSVMFAVYDVMTSLRSPVSTRCAGVAASAAGFLLATGTGTRSATPHAQIMLNQPFSELEGTTEDVATLARDVQRMQERMEHILGERTGQAVERIRADLARDHWMSAEQALAYGVIDEVRAGLWET